jgi:eukaryotic-like serine/threonine-protein kinase
MKQLRLIAVAGLCCILSTSRLTAAPFYQLPPLSVVQYSGYANDVFTATFKDRQVNFEIDLEKGRGFFNGKEGVLVVPIKDLSEDGIDKASGTRIGAPVCHLFWGPGLKPLANGKPIDKAKLRTVKALEFGGEESETTCFVCTVRREGDNLELCLYGADKDPVFTTRLEKAQGQNATDFDCSMTSVNQDPAVAVTLFGKYTASLPFAIDAAAHRAADDSMTARFGVSPRKSLSAPTTANKSAAAGKTASIGSQLQCDIERSGHWPNGDSLPKAGAVLWKFPPEEDASQFLPGTPVADKGIVYFGDNHGSFHALDAASGKEKWVKSYKGERMTAAPAIADGVAFIATESDLKCVKLENGEVRWSSELSASSNATPPLVVGDAVFVAGGDGVYAFKRADGQKIWSHNTLDDRPVVTPTFQVQFDSTGAMRPAGSASDGSLLFQTIYDQCRVVALDCRDGKQRWSYSARGWLTANPVVSGNSVLFGGYDLYLHCVDRQTGKEIWKSPTAASVVAAPAVANGCVYFTAENSRVHCVDLETGKRIWMYRMDPAAEGVICLCAPLVSDKLVYIGSTTGFVFALDTLSGEFKWGLPMANRCQISGAGFATDGKRLFAATRSVPMRANAGAIFALGDQ